MLMCDGFTGNFAESAGERQRREQWLNENNVGEPDRQPGGWSAKGQAADKINNHCKRLTGTYTDALLGYNHDILTQPRFEDCTFGPTGTTFKRVTAEQAAEAAIWVWQAMDTVLCPWAFTPVGYISEEEVA